ncbi:MAG: DUF2817 domain-containing protein [Rhizomicrobium sp.]
MKAEKHFPPDYKTARANFIAAAEARDLGTTARLNPNAKTRDGKNLFLDTTIIGKRDAKKALLMISATHGVEGYFGSGVQTGMLREGIEAPKGAKIVMLHALNPYGFAWDRRVNEDNADINRNFVDHKKPPMNKAYAAMAEAISPPNLSKTTWKEANAKLKAYSDKHGAFALQEAITRGQYKHPDGIYYGGFEGKLVGCNAARCVPRRIARREKADRHRFPHRSWRIRLWRDDHRRSSGFTRLPPREEDVGRSRVFERSGRIRVAAADRHGRQGDGELPAGNTTDLRGAGGRHNPVSGCVQRTAQGQFPAPLRRRKAQTGRRHRREIRASFYPDTKEWKRKVWKTANEVVNAALKALE